MNRKTIPLIALIALALGAAAATGSAQARDVDVQWSVTIGSPRVGVVVGAPVYAPRVYAPRVVTPPVVVVPQRGVHGPGVYGPGPGHVRGRSWRDADGDGIPNRRDRVYNPRWDVDGDGVPNRYDRHDHNPYRR